MAWVGALVGFFLSFTMHRGGLWLLWAATGFLVGRSLEKRPRSTWDEGTTEDVFDRLSRLERRVNDLQTKPQEPSAPSEPAPARAPTAPPPPPPMPRATSEWEESEIKEDVEISPPVPPPAPPASSTREIHHAAWEIDEVVHRESVALSSFRAFFTTGNVIAKVGVILLFFGVAFFLKWAADEGLYSIEMRLLSSAAFSIALMAMGWRLRNRQYRYGLILQGAGLGIFFLTVFVASKIDISGSFIRADSEMGVPRLLSPTIAFPFLVVAALLTVLLAVFQNSRSLADLSVSGGFLAPVLVSTGSGNHVALFGYFAILNLVVLGISRFKSWKELNTIAFIFTYGIGSLWGANHYVPEKFSTVEPFLLYHFLLFFLVSVFFTRLHWEISSKGLVDATLVFGVPIASFALQARLVKEIEYGTAWSAVGFGFFYCAAGLALFRRHKEEVRLLVESFFALGVCFLTLAVPFALSGAWTSATWALEGAAMVWVGARQRYQPSIYFGMALQILAMVAFISGHPNPADPIPFINNHFLSSLFLFFGAIAVAWVLLKKKGSVSDEAHHFSGLFVALALGWWFSGVLRETYEALPIWYRSLTLAEGLSWALTYGLRLNAMLLVAGVCLAGFFLISRPLRFPALGYARYGLVLLPVVAFTNLVHLRPSEYAPFLNPFFLGSTMLALANMLTAKCLRTDVNSDSDGEMARLYVFSIMGLLWWYSGLTWEISHAVPRWYALWTGEGLVWSSTTQALVMHAELVGLLVSGWVFYLLGVRLNWPEFRATRHILLGGAILLLPVVLALVHHPFYQVGIVVWPMVLFSQYLFLKISDNRSDHLSAAHHLGTYWLLTAVLTSEAVWRGHTHIDAKSVWQYALWTFVPGVLALAVIVYPRSRWPMRERADSYLGLGVIPHVLWGLFIGQILNVTHPGNAEPLPYFPLLNPLDISVMFSLVVYLFWYRTSSEMPSLSVPSRHQNGVGLGVFCFAWFTGMLIRTLHHFAGIPWSSSALFDSGLVQASLSIFWSLISLGVMVFSTSRRWRGLWISGSVLLATVVVKLFAVDLSKRGTVERFASFIGTGLLLLIIGYFAPIPPKKGNEK